VSPAAAAAAALVMVIAVTTDVILRRHMLQLRIFHADTTDRPVMFKRALEVGRVNAARNKLNFRR